jgi:hypothetical protein
MTTAGLYQQALHLLPSQPPQAPSPATAVGLLCAASRSLRVSASCAVLERARGGEEDT